MIRLCMGSRVIAETQDLGEREVHAHIGGRRVRLTEDGGRSPPHRVVGGCVLTRGGGAEWGQ